MSGTRGNLKSSNEVLFQYITETANGTADTTNDKWRRVTATGFGPFSSTLGSVDAEDLEPSAQVLEPSTVSEDAAADFTVNLRYQNVQRFLTGLLRNEYAERGSTDRIKKVTNPETVTAVVSDGYTTTNTNTTNGWSVPASGKLLVYAQGFPTAANNGRKFATAVTSTKVSVSGLTAESTAAGKLYICGFETATTAAYTKSSASARAKLTADANLSSFNLAKDEWIQVVDSNAHPADVPLFYGRVFSVTTSASKTTIEFDTVLPITRRLGTTRTTWTDANVSAKKLSLYFANRYINNPSEGKIKDVTYLLERQLSKEPIETELVCGAAANTLALSIPTRGKVTTNFAFVANQSFSNTAVTATSIVPALKEPMFNTSDNLPVVRLVNSDGEVLAVNFSDITVNVTNNITSVPATQTRYGVGTIHGNFTLTVSATAIFVNNKARRAALNDEVCSMALILKNRSGGIVLDIPSVKINTADTTLALGTQINVTLATAAFLGEQADYTLRWSYYNFLT